MRRAGEMANLVLVALVIPVALLVSFPYGKMHFTAPDRPQEPFCGIVNLTEEEFETALAAASSSWKTAGDARSGRIDLLTDKLPESEPEKPNRFDPRTVQLTRLPELPARMELLPRSRASAFPPAQPPSKQVQEKPAFSLQIALPL